MIDYVPVLLQIAFAIFFAAAILITSSILGQRGRRPAAKDIPYECGKTPEGNLQPRFSVKFYMIAMLFILFDIEVVFMYAWAVIYREQLANGLTILWAIFPFIGIFFVGELYAWKKGALDWVTRPQRRI
jgi:NADH-quinone oxidoreductase subunit A